MKKYNLLIAFAVVALFSMLSCSSKTKNHSQDYLQQEIKEQKQELADSVLVRIDALADEYFNASENGFSISEFELTDQEKKIQPDYLLDPSEVYSFVTKSQKVNALAIYMLELSVRSIYDLPTGKAQNAITMLMFDLNYPMNNETSIKDELTSEKIRAFYHTCKERGELACFWQFQNALLRETDYLISQNPDLYLSNITEEELCAFNKQWMSLSSAIDFYAKYDEELEQVHNTVSINNVDKILSDFSNIDKAKETFKSNKAQFAEKRNALLK